VFSSQGTTCGSFLRFIGKVVPIFWCTNCQHMPALVSVHLIGARDRHLSKLQRMTLFPMTRQEVPPLLALSGVLPEAQWDRVGHITSADRCRRPVGREKQKQPPCLISLAFRTECSQSVVMHTYTQIKGLALRFRGGSLHSCPQESEGVSVLEGSR